MDGIPVARLKLLLLLRVFLYQNAASKALGLQLPKIDRGHSTLIIPGRAQRGGHEVQRAPHRLKRIT
eukprot:scaffold33276_cov32-Tisochrysis_lutea.AAC.2